MTDTPPSDLSALRDDIRHTRAELGETVEALAAKADVKARVKQSAAETTERVKQSAAETTERVKESAGQALARVSGSLQEAGDSARRRPRAWLLAVVAGAAAVVTVTLVLRRRAR